MQEPIKLDCGLEGSLWAAKTEDDKLTLGDIVLSGRKFPCSDDSKETFMRYLESIEGEECEVTFFHSIRCTLPAQSRKRRKDKAVSETEVKKDDSIQYNCTVKSNKAFARSLFNGMNDRMNKVYSLIIQSGLSNTAVPENTSI